MVQSHTQTWSVFVADTTHGCTGWNSALKTCDQQEEHVHAQLRRAPGLLWCWQGTVEGGEGEGLALGTLVTFTMQLPRSCLHGPPSNIHQRASSQL